MAGKNEAKRSLPSRISEFSKEEGGLTGPQIAVAYKAALSDFVSRSTSRSSTREISRLLSGALAARRQEISELNDENKFGITEYY